MTDESTAPKYPILDEIDVSEQVIANWQITVDLLAEIAGVPAALIMRVHAHDIEVFVASHSPGNVYHPGEKASLDTGLYCETVMSTRCELLVSNASKDPDWAHNPDIKLDMISYCGLPLTWPNGELFGTICILDTKENAYSPRTHHLLERFRDSIQFSLDSIYTAVMERKQRVQAEEAVQTAQTQVQLYLDLVGVIIVAIDADQRVTLINNKGAELLGYPQDEIIGMNWYETFIPARLREQVTAASWQLMRGEIAPVEYFENPVVTRAGEERLIAWHNTVLRDDEGRIIGTLSAGEDITERRHAGNALQETVTRLRTVLDALPIGVLILDTHAQIVQSNGQAERIYSGAASLPEPLQEYRRGRAWWTATGQPVQDEDWPSVQALRHGAVVTDQEMNILRADGARATILEAAAPLRDAQGNITGVVVVIRDISESKEVDRAKNQFLNVISHEMRTPLTAILGWAQLAEDDPTLSADALHAIHQSAQAQHGVLERLILLSRILTGKLTLQRQPADLWVLADQVATANQLCAQERQVTLRCNPPAEPLPVSIDPKLMRQALQEMLDNALKYTSAGGHMTVSATRMQDQAVVAVHDTGQGIALEDLPKLWKPFQQVVREESLGGLGIGLVLLRGIVEAHGGQVFVVSPGVGKGSTYSISIALVLPLPGPPDTSAKGDSG
jgi:PAS domain S-box-containing protein